MRTERIKLTAITAFATACLGFMTFYSSNMITVKADGDVAADYKTKCAGCHTAKAEKFLDPSKSIADLTNTILKGKKGEKPPFMPAFETKQMSADSAKALAEYMVSLRKPAAAANTNTSSNTNTNSNANSNTTTPSCPCPTASASPSPTATPTPQPTPTPAPAQPSEQLLATYKTKCLACHSATAAKFFDATKTNEVLANIVLKGNATSKPAMPAFESKGITAADAASLVSYMKSLKPATK